MFQFMPWVFAVWAYLLRVFRALLCPAKFSQRFGRRKAKVDKHIFYHRQPKPTWVKNEIIRHKALMPEAGCRKIAHTFNRIFAQSKKMTVSKTFVHETMRKHKYEIQALGLRIKNRRPKPVPMNLIWGVDLTGLTDDNGDLRTILGIIEHQSRINLGLAAIKDKTVITILRFLLDVIESYGKPRFLRTDNEPIFTSWIFRFSLWLLAIRHQTIDICCPWQNGRVERFFGTLKEKLDQWEVINREQLNGALGQFRFWYNHVRPHQNLDGRTPSEVWNEIDIFTERPKKTYWFEAWDGLLTGIYLKL